MLRDEGAFVLWSARCARIPLRGSRQPVKQSPIGRDGFGKAVVSQDVQVVTGAPQLTQQRPLRRHVAAAVP